MLVIQALDGGSIYAIAIRPLSPALPFSTSMTVVSSGPAWWPTIHAYRFSSYFIVAAFVGIMYDWVLTFGQEVELVWRQRWSLMTVLYLSLRYLGILYAAPSVLASVMTISLTDTKCWTVYVIWNWSGIVTYTMLWVIIITRLHAMYQQSRKILIFLIITFLAVNIFNTAVVVITTIRTSGEELILSGTHQCSIHIAEDILLLDSIGWILSIVWEVLTLCLAVWIAVKHFCELRRDSAGGIIGDCFTVLIKTHVLYFASFLAVSCFQLIVDFSSMDQYYLDTQICGGVLDLLEVVQSFVMGPRLILSIREYHAKLAANTDAATGMSSIAFQERVHISTSSGV